MMATDAERCRGEDVIVVGGGNSAGQAATHLARLARSVRVVVRGKALKSTMSHYLVERIESSPRIEVMTETEVSAVHGSETVESVTLVDRRDGSSEQVPCTAVFVMIGADPCTESARGLLALDDAGYLLCGAGVANCQGHLRWPLSDREPHLLETVRPGVFAAGDVRAEASRRVAGAVGDGALVVRFAYDVLAGSAHEGDARTRAQAVGQARLPLAAARRACDTQAPARDLLRHGRSSAGATRRDARAAATRTVATSGSSSCRVTATVSSSRAWRTGPELPSELQTLLTAYLRGSALRPVADLETLRRAVRVSDGRGPAAEVVHDSVRVHEGDRVVREFDEVEVEQLTAGSERLIERLERQLRAAGAKTSDGRPKVFRALGLPASVDSEGEAHDASGGAGADLPPGAGRSAARGRSGHAAG